MQSDYGLPERDDDPATQAYLGREETFTTEMGKLTHSLWEKLLDEMERLNQLGSEAPVKFTRIGKWDFYTRNFKNYLGTGDQTDAGYYRMKFRSDEEGPRVEEKLLDTRLMRWRGFIAGKLVLAPNPNYFAFTVRSKNDPGTETAELWVQHINDKGVVDTITIIPNILNFVWSGDSKSIYYTVLDERLRSSKVIVRSVEYEEENRLSGKHPRQRDRVVYDEINPHWFLDISRSKDDKYIIIHSGSLTSSEVHLIDATEHYNPIQRPDFFPKPALVEPRAPGVEYFVDHHEDKLFVLTNRQSPNQFRMMITSVAKSGATHWREWIKLQPDETVEDVDVFKNYVVTYGRRSALPFIQVHRFNLPADAPADAHRYEIPLPEKYCMVRPSINPEYDTNILKFTYNSPFTSELNIEFDMENRRLLEIDGRQLQNF
ncbi:peptidase S9A, N-terminal domain-containing protein, partial [Dimargaris cristalligena]